MRSSGIIGPRLLLSEMAWLESASVPAFLRLADELKAHGAPEALIRAAIYIRLPGGAVDRSAWAAVDPRRGEVEAEVAGTAHDPAGQPQRDCPNR